MMEEGKIRLFVGGLGPEVSSGDLKERFAPLGNVQSIALPPSKAGSGHRGFAYVDFVPATDASLRKLFSAYNGCKWRGGLLRIEKAKEDFTDRLHREWVLEEASETADPPPIKPVETVQPAPLKSGRQKQANGLNREDLEASDLKIFFPRLKKLKNVPLTGLGKHKRSFQRVESSPLQSLLACACEENLRSGSCDCSKINSGTPSLKEDISREDDEIAEALEIERERQLSLLDRLFPSDSTSISENQKVVELDESDEKEISVPQGAARGTGITSSGQPPLQIKTERVKQDRPKHKQRSEIESVVGEGLKGPVISELASDNVEPGSDDDPTSTAVARERAKQLELMNRLFPADAPSTREPETVIELDVSRAKKKQKLLAPAKTGGDLTKPLIDSPRDTKTDHSVHHLRTLAQANTQKESAAHQELPTEEEEEARVSESTPAIKSDDEEVERASEVPLVQVDDSIQLEIAEDEEKQPLESVAPVPEGFLTEDDSEMVLNFGDDSLPLAVGEELEKDELKSLSVRASELLEKVSEMSRHISDDSFSLASAAGRDRQTPESSSDVISEDESEDEEMTLNLGDDSVPFSKAEEQEKALVRNFAAGKHYDWTGADNSSDAEDAEEMEDNEMAEYSEEEEGEGASDGSSDPEEALETEDIDMEVDRSEDESSDSEEADQAVDITDEGDFSDGSSDAEEAGEAQANGTESDPSEDQVHALDDEDFSEPSTIGRPESKLAEDSLQGHEGESSLGKRSDDSSKWAALADMCQFRGEEIIQPEESKLERSSAHMPISCEDNGEPSVPIRIDTSETPSQQQTEGENDGDKPEDPSTSDQRLTRAAWKSLVGETGRVVFSLRQVTGSTLPQTQTLTPETQTIEESSAQAVQSVSSKTLSQNQAKAKVAVREKKQAVGRSSIKPKMNAEGLTSTPVIPAVSSGDVCPFMKSENAEKEWLATKSDLRSDYRAKQKYAARNVKKLRGKR